MTCQHERYDDILGSCEMEWQGFRHALMAALSGKGKDFRFEEDTFVCPRGFRWVMSEEAWFCFEHTDPEFVGKFARG